MGNRSTEAEFKDRFDAEWEADQEAYIEKLLTPLTDEELTTLGFTEARIKHIPEEIRADLLQLLRKYGQ